MMNNLPQKDQPVDQAAAPMLRWPMLAPRVTYVIIGVTVIIYLLQIGTKLWLGVDIPGALGVKANELISAGQVWRLFTPMLLHDNSSFMHIFFNMYFLYIVGVRVEQLNGYGRFLALYVLSGFAGVVLSFMFSPYPAWGASGALFGLLGAEAVFALRNRTLLPNQGKALLKNALTVATINIVIGFIIGADNWGHLGGFLGGAMFSWFAGPIWAVHPVALNTLEIADEREPHELINGGVLTFIAFGTLAAIKIFNII